MATRKKKARRRRGTPSAAPKRETYRFSNAREAAIIEAAVARLIQANQTGPGARGSSFPQLSPQDQDAYLATLAKDARELNGAAPNVFFDSLLSMTIEGFFSYPA